MNSTKGLSRSRAGSESSFGLQSPDQDMKDVCGGKRTMAVDREGLVAGPGSQDSESAFHRRHIR